MRQSERHHIKWRRDSDTRAQVLLIQRVLIIYKNGNKREEAWGGGLLLDGVGCTWSSKHHLFTHIPNFSLSSHSQSRLLPSFHYLLCPLPTHSPLSFPSLFYLSMAEGDQQKKAQEELSSNDTHPGWVYRAYYNL